MHAQTTIMSSATGNRVIGSTVFKIAKFFILLFRRVFLHLLFFLFPVHLFLSSAHPLSANIKSPGSIKSINPDVLVMC